MLPFGAGYIPSATTAPAGTGVSVGLCTCVLTGSGVTAWEIAEFATAAVVSGGVGAPDAWRQRNGHLKFLSCGIKFAPIR